MVFDAYALPLELPEAHTQTQRSLRAPLAVKYAVLVFLFVHLRAFEA